MFQFPGFAFVTLWIQARIPSSDICKSKADASFRAPARLTICAIDQQRIQAFADCTDDPQWIHVDVERANRESPFGEPIAHGFLTLSLLTRFLNEIGALPPDASRVINSGVNNVRFKSAVRSGARIRGRIRLSEAVPKGEDRWLVTLAATMEVENQKDPAMTADMVVMLFR